MKSFTLAFGLLLMQAISIAQSPAVIEWQKSIGGSSNDYMYTAIPTTDGGYILGGYSSSGISGDKSESRIGASGTFDYWVVKCDAAGSIQWQNTIGGSADDYLRVIAPTTDGGYILGGSSNSPISGDKTEGCIGMTDYWIVKIDGAGSILWQNTIGGSSTDDLFCLQATADGGFIMGGTSWSGVSGDKTEAAMGWGDYWVVKVNSFGVIEWQNSIGGNDTEVMRAVVQTTDGGYMVGGFSWSGINYDRTVASRGNKDYWILKLNAAGLIEWQQAYGGSSHDELYAIILATDGGYLLAGSSGSGITGDKTEVVNGGWDCWLIKTDAAGAIQWQNTIGGSGVDYAMSTSQLVTGNFLIGAYTSSGLSGDKTTVGQGLNDYWVMELDGTGNIVWQNSFGGNNEELLFTILPVSGGGFVCGGYSGSGISGDKTVSSKGLTDYWLVKLGFSCTVEVCDGVDNDCDGEVDEGLPVYTYYTDFDNDGYGNAALTIEYCSPVAPAGYSTNGLDCADWNAYWSPAAQEQCNFVDDDCDGLLDINDPSCLIYPLYPDVDLDGYGNGWAGPVDSACYGYPGAVLSMNDCDDTDPDVHPGATEYCNGIDDDCDGWWDYDDGSLYYLVVYPDNDGDGFGNMYAAYWSCNGIMPGYILNGDDCDDEHFTYADVDLDGYGTGPPIGCGIAFNNGDCQDFDPAVFPGAIEYCDGADNDCDGIPDNDIVYHVLYIDSDGDGYGNPDISISVCEEYVYGYITDNTDCNDNSNMQNPGNLFELNNGIDDDCDGLIDNDLSLICPSSPYEVIWDNTIGGVHFEWTAYSVLLPDGGYMIAGTSNSGVSGDKTLASKGLSDYWFLRLDQSGAILWQKVYGGSGDDGVRDLIATADGGFLIGGASVSPASGDKTEGVIGGGTVNPDFWLVKVDSIGNLVWQNTIGGNRVDELMDIAPLNDGGFILVGYSTSDAFGDKTQPRNGPDIEAEDFWLVRLDANGNVLWDKTIGTMNSDFGNAILPLADGTMILAGESYGGVSVDKTENAIGYTDIWLLKLDDDGSIIWQNTIGGTDYEWSPQIAHADGGDFFIVCYSYSTANTEVGDKLTSGYGSGDYWVMRVSSTGTLIWERTYGGSSGESVATLVPDGLGGAFVAGSSMSGISGNKQSINYGSTDTWIVQIDGTGEVICQTSIGGASSDGCGTLIQLSNGNLFVSGSSMSNVSGDKSEPAVGQYDFWVFEIAPKMPVYYYSDSDDDGYGVDVDSILACYDPDYYADNTDDCNDADPEVSPAVSYDADNGIDDNCDGWVDNNMSCLDQPLELTYNVSFGSGLYDIGSAVIQVPDGGYIIGGVSLTGAGGSKVPYGYGGFDYWVIKTNASFEIEWQKVYGGTDDEWLKDIVLLPDGGYIVFGESESPASGLKSEELIGTYGLKDIWILRIDPNGNIIWENAVGGEGYDIVSDAVIKADGNLLFGASSADDVFGDKTIPSNGEYDYWLFSMDLDGNIYDQLAFGGSASDYLMDMELLTDGSCVLAGYSYSGVSGDKSEPNMGSYGDFWIIKLDTAGNILWENTIGGSQMDVAYTITELSDQNILVGGYSVSGVSGDKSEPTQGGADYWVIKLDTAGQIVWQNTIGGAWDDVCYNIGILSDGSALLTGYSSSYPSGDKTIPNFMPGNMYSYDVWVVRIDTMGALTWQFLYGGERSDYTTALLNMGNDVYLVAGYSDSYPSGNKTSASWGGYDLNLFKIEPVYAQYYYPDTDGDGYGDENALTEICSALPGYVTVGGDCNDTNASVHPYATEMCNGFDDDCDGIVDEGMAVIATITAGGATSFCNGSSVLLSANTGAGYTYQWLKNGVALPGATASTYLAMKAGTYSTQLTVPECGTTTSNSIPVTVWPKPKAKLMAAGSLDICLTGSVTLQASTGAGYTYKWYKDNVLITGATSNTYVATSVGSYKVKVTNTYGCNKTSQPKTVFSSCKEGEEVSAGLLVYPNPTTSRFTVVLPVDGPYVLVITDGLGRQVSQITGSDREVQISLEDAAAGVYRIQVFTPNNVYTEPVVKL